MLGVAPNTLQSFCLHTTLPYVYVGTAGQLTRAAVELAKLWRTDKYLRRLDVR